MIPATLQIEQLNPAIRGLHNGNLEVVRANRKWNADYAAINAIGINQYYGHMIIKRNPKKKVIVKCDIPRILPISTRTEETVERMLAKVSKKCISELKKSRNEKLKCRIVISGHGFWLPNPAISAYGISPKDFSFVMKFASSTSKG